MIFNYQKYNKLASFTLSLLCSHSLYFTHAHIQRSVTFKYSMNFQSLSVCLEVTSFVAPQFDGLQLTQSSCISSAAHIAISYSWWCLHLLEVSWSLRSCISQEQGYNLVSLCSPHYFMCREIGLPSTVNSTTSWLVQAVGAMLWLAGRGLT